MKKIKIVKKASQTPILLKNGDKYDGVLQVLDKDDKLLVELHCNTDPTNGYQGGEVAAGEYIAKRVTRRDGRTAYHLYTQDGSDILPSTRPNPNHNGKMVIQAVQIHIGGLNWDGSHGCITIPPAEFADFLAAMGGEKEATVEILEKIAQQEQVSEEAQTTKKTRKKNA